MIDLFYLTEMQRFEYYSVLVVWKHARKIRKSVEMP